MKRWLEGGGARKGDAEGRENRSLKWFFSSFSYPEFSICLIYGKERSILSK